METTINDYISQEQYLESERLATEKHEYFEGAIYDRGPKSFIYNDLFKNTFGYLAIGLQRKKCQPYGSDLRLHIPKNTLYTYPSISIYCDEIDTIDNNFDTATNPIVLFEITSNTSQLSEKIDKFDLYRDIVSLKEYIMINSEKIQVLKHVRNPDNSWLMTVYESLDDSFSIQSIAVELKLSDIYFDVKCKNSKNQSTVE